jgi:hypothetical protein
VSSSASASRCSCWRSRLSILTATEPQSAEPTQSASRSLARLAYRCQLSALLAVCLLLAGCGGAHQSGTDKALMNLEFATADLAIARQVARDARDGSGQLEAPTRYYIALTRKYDDALGDKEIRQRLADKATEVQDWCPSCAAALDREREIYD